jgi:hypothetical protein
MVACMFKELVESQLTTLIKKQQMTNPDRYARMSPVDILTDLINRADAMRPTSHKE